MNNKKLNLFWIQFFLIIVNYIYFINFINFLVTARIKERNGQNTIIAHAENDVTIMFCDILQFQDMIKFLSPTEFVCTLNELYSAMDFLCVKYFVQKMETVGKTYMVI